MTSIAQDQHPNLQMDKLYIGGEWRRSNSGQVIESINPATEDVWAEVAEADDDDVDAAVEAAESALRGPWSRMSASERGTLLLTLAELIRSNQAELAILETSDNGKPIRDTRAEIARAADWMTYYAGAADKLSGETIPFRPSALAYTIREPIGVVAAITPWNSPFSMYSWKLGPALSTGNTVVLKPSTSTPVTALKLAELVDRAGFPPGVVNVIPGRGRTTGNALVRHPGVNKVAFTGESATGQEIMRIAATDLKRLTLECGGKSPNIVFADADLDKALVVANHAAFRGTGQSCSIASRLFIERSVYAAFVKKLVVKAAAIRVGDPMDSSTHLGPQISRQQLEKTLSYVEVGKQEGARLELGGSTPQNLRRGYYVEPTVFSDVEPTSRLAQEEIFGPVLSVIPFTSEEEVIEMANGTKFGLVAAIWTRDVTRAHRMASQISAGLVSVNTYRPMHFTLPYGGYKLSGLGRENGMEALREYTELKTVVIELSTQSPPDPFAD